MPTYTIKRGFRSLNTARQRPRVDRAPGSHSSLRTVKRMDEVKGMRSIRRWGQDEWERAVDEQRQARARSRRLSRRQPGRGDLVEA